VRVGDEQVRERVLFDRRGADDALAAARLAAVGRQRLALDVAAPETVITTSSSAIRSSSVISRSRRPGCASALAGVLVASSRSSSLMIRRRGRVGEDVLELGDQLDRGEVLVLDLLALERGEARSCISRIALAWIS
jgi:hypothetical protein